MKRGMIYSALGFLFLIGLLNFSTAYSESVDASIRQLTYQAEQYETGNINYAQLLIYLSSLKKDIAISMGASSNSMKEDLTLSQSQLESVFGKATDYSRWVWVEDRDKGGGYEKKLENQVPNWRKIIFDGGKIQILLNAWPQMRYMDGKEKMFYRINFETRFKSAENTIDLQSDIDEIKSLADAYANDKSTSSLSKLAKKTVSVEQTFKNYYNINGEKCVDLMTDLFGSENKKPTQKMLHDEIDFASGKKTDVIINIDMCDDCEWNWIGINVNVQTRGRYNGDNGDREELMGRYKSYSDEEFKAEIKKILENIKQDAINDNVDALSRESTELSALSEAWNQKSNEETKNINDIKDFFERMSEDERRECSKTFCWIKKEQERREKEKSLMNQKYNERKEFYLSLFSADQIKESYYEEERWEKRILEKFREEGEEKCDNNIDDNKNNQVDCADDQCSGKKCGYETVKIEDGNETKEEKLELFCIAGTCQKKDENLSLEQNQSKCGNHICEADENTTCSKDCEICPTYEAINCSGQAIYSGKDKNGCLLAPICIDENMSCSLDSDCINPLCGNSSCVEGTCKIMQITECREAECADGDEKIEKCSGGGEMFTDKCIEGIWRKTGAICAAKEANETETEIETDETEIESNNTEVTERNNTEVRELANNTEIGGVGNKTVDEKTDVKEDSSTEITKEDEKEIAGSECSAKEDCGNENDVCSNGKCITLPSTIESKESEKETVEISIPEKPAEDSDNDENTQANVEEQKTEDKSKEKVTGKSILSIFTNFLGITGREITETPSEQSQTQTDTQTGSTETTSTQTDSVTPTGETNTQTDTNSQTPGSGVLTSPDGTPQDNQNPDQINDEENQRREEERARQKEEQKRRDKEDLERRTKECSDQCSRQCYDTLLRPCIEDCIWKKCGDQLKCNVDDTRVACESSCKSEKDSAACENNCKENCIKGKETRMEPQKNERKPETFVLSMTGSCRKGTLKEEIMLWFNAWGDDIKDLQQYKMKYYNKEDNEWCKQDLESLIKQRKELERSLNNEFAQWFFEKYIVNTDSDWDKHMSGISDLYWMDIEISKQMDDRMRCLGINKLPDYKLINFTYKTSYGSIEFWEEISFAEMSDDGKKTEIISPFMRTWLFPTRDFYKSGMKKAMENHVMIGENSETTNTLPADVIERLKEDSKFMNSIKKFNEKGYSNIALQLKDFTSDEIYFNVLIKINEKDIMYFEPMPVSQLPSNYVTCALDVNKLINVIEYSEKGRVELQSPPWDKRPREQFIKGAVDNVRLYFKFQEFMNSLKVSESNVKGESKLFVQSFFNLVMNGDNEKNGGENKGDGEKDKDNKNDNNKNEDGKGYK